MAKLNSYYTLCPLIDQQSLLGVEKDSSCGCAVVTLGRNIVIRYKLQDLKQVSSWSSKERLTTQVIYDRTTSRYVAVFNEIQIRVWSEEENDLDKVKRHKFKYPLHTIVNLDGESPVLVRQNGTCASLAWALKNRKTWDEGENLLKPGEKIVDCNLVHAGGKTYLCMLTRLDSGNNYLVVPLEDDTYREERQNVKRLDLRKTSEDLVGHVVTQNQNNAYLLTLWSTGRLYSYCITGNTTESVPGSTIGMITTLSTKHPVVMTALNECTIAAYGADALEEGAVLIIYNVRFKLTQATQKLKLYTRDAKLWRVEDKLLLAANRHLAVAPYYLAPQRIEALLGSSRAGVNEEDGNEEEKDVIVIHEAINANWGNHSETSSPPKFSAKGVMPKKIAKQISSYVKEGLSDAAIQEILIPQLVEAKDFATIAWCLDKFKDMPEKLVATLLSCCLRTPERSFQPVQNGTAHKSTGSYSPSRNEFLDKILSADHSEVSLLSHLKSELTFTETLRLLEYLVSKIDSKELDNCLSSPNDDRLLEWTAHLLDSHYQHYILSQDPEVLKILSKLETSLENHFQLLKELENLRPMLQRIVNGKPLKPSRRDFNKFYSIEEVKLY
ncbi:nucleolar protein 11 [Orussus abietinus]|uniref:nucleolar protein 11 n=1 Tax=Orussus abietinus TaxID=222816 RepID=UPI000625FFCC|nr:nucleolar protein 11 [Orussus abietinus]